MASFPSVVYTHGFVQQKKDSTDSSLPCRAPIAEVLADTGIIFGSRDHEELAAALIFMLEQGPDGTARRAAYGEAARQRALANYTMASGIGRFESIYNAAIKGGKPGALELIEGRIATGAAA